MIIEQDAALRLAKRLQSNESDAWLLSHIHFLSQDTVRQFFDVYITELSRSASRISTRNECVVRGEVRGHINWPKTYLSRGSMKIDSGSAIASSTRASWDTPENRLVKLFLFNVINSIDLVAREIGSGAIVRQALDMRLKAEVVLKQPWMREVGRSSHQMESLMRQRAKRSKNWLYGLIVDLEELYEEIFHKDKWETILSLLSKGWLEPIPSDDLFELYALVNVLEVLKYELSFGNPVSVNLIKPKRKEIVSFWRENDSTSARIYFDQSPVELFDAASEYKNVLNEYIGASGTARRPDISVRFELGNGEVRTVFVECKKSDDDGYRRDSIYKGLGYLRDFADLWTPSQKPKVIVAFPQNVSQKHLSKFEPRDLALVASDDRQSIAKLLEQAIS